VQVEHALVSILSIDTRRGAHALVQVSNLEFIIESVMLSVLGVGDIVSCLYRCVVLHDALRWCTEL
jgi:hypothetical protein